MVGAKEGVNAGILVKLFGGGFKQKPAVWQTASPVTWASSNSAPMLIVHGDTDALVPLEQAQVLTLTLQQAGAKAELIVVKNGDHGMQPAKRDIPAEPSVHEIHRQVLRFFDKHLVK